jgi:hypothetical protein
MIWTASGRADKSAPRPRGAHGGRTRARMRMSTRDRGGDTRGRHKAVTDTRTAENVALRGRHSIQGRSYNRGSRIDSSHQDRPNPTRASPKAKPEPNQGAKLSSHRSGQAPRGWFVLCSFHVLCSLEGEQPPNSKYGLETKVKPGIQSPGEFGLIPPLISVGTTGMAGRSLAGLGQRHRLEFARKGCDPSSTPLSDPRRRADRALDPVRSVEQRGNRPYRLRPYVEQRAALQGKGVRIARLTASRISSLVQHQVYRGPGVAHHRCAKSLHRRFAVET